MPKLPPDIPVASATRPNLIDAQQRFELSRLRGLGARASVLTEIGGLSQDAADVLRDQFEAPEVTPVEDVLDAFKARTDIRIDAAPPMQHERLEAERSKLREHVRVRSGLQEIAGDPETINRRVMDGLAAQAAAVRVDPELFQSNRRTVAAILDEMGITGPVRTSVDRRAVQRLARAAVAGTIDTLGGAVARAQLETGAFDDVLAPEVKDHLLRMAALAETDQASRAAMAQAVAKAQEVGRLQAEIRAGRAGMEDALDAFAEGRFGADARDRLCQQAEAKAAQERAKREQVEGTVDRLAGDGPPLDPDNPDDVRGANLYYDETVVPVLHGLDPPARAKAVGDAVIRLGVVPARATTLLSVSLRSDDPATKFAAAQAIDRIAQESGILAAGFDSEDVAFARDVSDARDAGLAPDESVRIAERRREVRSRRGLAPSGDAPIVDPAGDETIAAVQGASSASAFQFIRDERTRRHYLRRIAELSRDTIAEVEAGELTIQEGAAKASSLRNTRVGQIRESGSMYGKGVAEDMKPAAALPDLKKLEAQRADKLFGKTFTELTPSQKVEVWTEIMESAGRGNTRVTRRVMALGKAGRALFVLSAALAAYEVFQAEDKVSALLEEGAKIAAGAAVGAAGGVVGGAALGPVGAFIGVLAGGIAGALGVEVAFDTITGAGPGPTSGPSKRVRKSRSRGLTLK